MPPQRSSQSLPKGKSKAQDTSASQAPTSAPVSWSLADVNVLIDEVIAQQAKAGNGLNFRPSVWTSISACPGLSKSVKGGPKTGKSCREKWKRVW
ncbi:hypothetical protein PAXRUDRAFT_159969 [Paxillus rubicundulus Ve08.2h10]|uniref:Myb-like domain-containing protein n=1 Tax=Paxillus rubicundulus Ve08.2h10 TaxID=930991 RepID=A0A0D0CWM8_9AGAM|nr:hypothetical protein PAXRUDRAFT_159969 [Paxillus rubicundulus Ve08.2h10]